MVCIHLSLPPHVTLYTQLKTARSEEDVKDAYIKALGLKSYTKGLVDIQTNEVWFEAKAYDKLTETLGKNWQQDYVVWDMCCGVGNLEVKHSNRTAGADGLEWNGRTWSLVNHFIPFTESEVGAPDRFESDFMVQYLADKTLSAEALAVLDGGRGLWRAYFAHTDVRTLRDQYKLNRPDVGWYQVRKALQARNASGDTAPVNHGPFEQAYQTLTDKLQPQVFSLGFLR